MAEEDVFLVDDFEGGLCVDYTDARINEDDTVEAIRRIVKWENDDYICRGHILNGMSDSLFDIYIRMLNRLRSYEILLNPSTRQRMLRLRISWAVVRLPDPKRETFGEKCIDCIFVGYAEHLKALGYSSKNYVRKFLRALHPKWRAKVKVIEESKDLTSLSLDELIGNLKVHEMIIKKDSKIVKEKVERKSLALKAKKESSDEECLTFRSKRKNTPWRSQDDKNGKSDRKCFRCSDLNHLIVECPKPPKDKNQRSFAGGSWSDSGEEDDENVNNETCLVAQASSKICLGVDLEPDEWINDSECSKHMTGMIDNTLFTKKKSSNLIIVQIYVDDIIFGLTCQDICDEFAKTMHEEFEMSMMDELNFFLGLQIKQMEDGIFFNQSKYIKEMLKKFSLEDSKPMKTPMYSDTKLTKDEECESADSTKYRGMIEFAQILNIPCKGACVLTDKWSLEELAYGVLTDGPYQTNPPSPDDIILSIRIDREGQVRIRHEEEIDVLEYQILTCEIVPTLKPLEEIIQENIFCLRAIDDEIDSIMENNTWVSFDLPPGCKPLGFRQKEGIDYFDTYALVARITTIRLLLALAAIHNVVIYQMDVKIAFLNGDLDEKVYMRQPEGFVMPVDKTKKFLSSRFLMKDMGEADVILGIKIKCENKRIVITQSHYIEKFLKKINLEDCSPVSTLMDPGEKLKPNTGKPMDQLEYSRAIGCLMYAMTSTRVDIAYAIGRLSRFTSNPSRQHWQAITRINHVEDSSSTSGWVFLLGGGAILWASKKQTYIIGSTIESEFVALAATGKEAEWLRNLIHEILIWPKPIVSISIRCDSAAILAKAYSQMYNGKSRHLGVRHSMIRELIMNNVISIESVRS
nr:zinc finger, CCHC-type [Tanacetum cinerariifolium]